MTVYALSIGVRPQDGGAAEQQSEHHHDGQGGSVSEGRPLPSDETDSSYQASLIINAATQPLSSGRV